jgi:hypothetical protein
MKRLLACFGLLALVSLAHAQPAPPPGAFDCRMLAGMPHAPMSVETCERRMAVHLEMMSALDTPGGERPGDERMSCDAILAELKTMNVSGVSAANAAEGKAASENVMAIMQRAQMEAMGMMGAQTARSAAAAAVPGNAAGHAAAMGTMAEQKAMQDRVGAQMGPARDRLEAASMNAMGDLVRTMRANPRFARLVKLAGERNCQG